MLADLRYQTEKGSCGGCKVFRGVLNAIDPFDNGRSDRCRGFLQRARPARLVFLLAIGAGRYHETGAKFPR